MKNFTFRRIFAKDIKFSFLIFGIFTLLIFTKIFLLCLKLLKIFCNFYSLIMMGLIFYEIFFSFISMNEKRWRAKNFFFHCRRMKINRGFSSKLISFIFLLLVSRTQFIRKKWFIWFYSTFYCVYGRNFKEFFYNFSRQMKSMWKHRRLLRH